MLVLIGLYACQDTEKSTDITPPPKKYELNESQARAIFDMPMHCLTVEYPNKLGQSLGSDADLKPPRELRPIFYGCYDWHSSVHGYWSIVKLMKEYPQLDVDGRVRTLLNEHLTAENAAIEKAFFEDVHNLGFERTYGWAWLMKLQEELITWEEADAQRWSEALQPLVNLLSNRLKEYLPKLVYPIRHGKHENSAFGLSLMIDYARAVKDFDLESVIVSHSNRLYNQDQSCDMAYEPSGSDFLSPCLEEAYLMAKVVHEDEYRKWLKDFMPTLFDHDFQLEPAVVKDRSDGQLVHLDGLNYSRAACLYGISATVPELAHIRQIADAHMAYTLPNLSKEDDYMGSHWLATFALYALTHQ